MLSQDEFIEAEAELRWGWVRDSATGGHQGFEGLFSSHICIYSHRFDCSSAWQQRLISRNETRQVWSGRLLRRDCSCYFHEISTPSSIIEMSTTDATIANLDERQQPYTPTSFEIQLLLRFNVIHNKSCRLIAHRSVSLLAIDWTRASWLQDGHLRGPAAAWHNHRTTNMRTRYTAKGRE